MLLFANYGLLFEIIEILEGDDLLFKKYSWRLKCCLDKLPKFENCHLVILFIPNLHEFLLNFEGTFVIFYPYNDRQWGSMLF